MGRSAGPRERSAVDGEPDLEAGRQFQRTFYMWTMIITVALVIVIALVAATFQ